MVDPEERLQVLQDVLTSGNVENDEKKEKRTYAEYCEGLENGMDSAQKYLTMGSLSSFGGYCFQLQTSTIKQLRLWMPLRAQEKVYGSKDRCQHFLEVLESDT